MLSELWKRIRDFVQPYSFQDFVEEYDPKDHRDLKELEQRWTSISSAKFFPKAL